MTNSLRSLSPATRLITSLAASMLLGAAVAGLNPTGSFLNGWLAAGVLIWISLFCLLSAWKWAGMGRLLGFMIGLIFLLHLVVGVGLSLALPAWGYDEPVQKAGYLFYDASQRDTQAWELAKSSSPLLHSFEQEFATDQYGGLLALSAAVYRYLSPDAHRPSLIIILGAFIMALGLPFFWRGIRDRWGIKVANLAAWIYVLYPDGLLYGSSQMREPFLIGFIGITIWAALAWSSSRRAAVIAMAGSVVGLALMSSRILAVVIGVMVIWFWLDNFGKLPHIWQTAGWTVTGFAGLALIVLSWSWLAGASHWDILVTIHDSGWVRKVYDEIGGLLWAPFVVARGLVQPVLPAAIIDPANAVWKVIVICSSLGWYLLGPVLIYSFIAIWKVKSISERRLFIWLAVMSLIWVVISSARAGGDQWDNPRYRTIFLPFMALLAGWAIAWAYQKKDVWLGRIFAIEGLFVVVFGSWYLSRYMHIGKRLVFWNYFALIGLLAVVVLAGGFLWDRRRSQQKHLLKTKE
ncbi:MAG: hypothetical protein P4L50_17195 [Anaerolineaceae bacterium]|nr:hypothetical protein [Anaerolineaceae bacterium]